MSGFPYEGQFAINRTLPEEGTSQEDVLSMLSTMSTAENPMWESGQCSGTMYCGDHDHYDFLNLAFSNFSYVNSLQRDMCPSATKFEAEIIAMTLDLLGAGTI
jgi:sphinganine-1-phosphate aldolase